MTQEWKAGSVSSSYKEVVKAKLDALTAEEVNELPNEHGTREFHKWCTVGRLEGGGGG